MNNDTLVDSIAVHELTNGLKSLDSKVVKAMRHVDRKKFIPEVTNVVHREIILSKMLYDFNRGSDSFAQAPYLDMALPIGYGQTCSQPSVVALMTQLLEIQPGMNVLEVGTGCGYQTAILSEIVGSSGHIFSIENVSSLVRVARQNLNTHFGPDYEQRISLIHGDGSEGYPLKGPYHRILFTAGVNSEWKFDASILIPQLSTGILVYPNASGPIIRERYDTAIKERTEWGMMMFVPLKKGCVC